MHGLFFRHFIFSIVHYIVCYSGKKLLAHAGYVNQHSQPRTHYFSQNKCLTCDFSLKKTTMIFFHNGFWPRIKNECPKTYKINWKLRPWKSNLANLAKLAKLACQVAKLAWVSSLVQLSQARQVNLPMWDKSLVPLATSNLLCVPSRYILDNKFTI